MTSLTFELIGPWVVLAVGLGLTAVSLYVLIRAHYSANTSISLEYLLLDGSLRPPRVTLAKAGGLLALVVSSWIMVLLAVSGKLDGTIFTAYVIGWGATKVAGDFTALRERKESGRVDNPDA